MIHSDRKIVSVRTIPISVPRRVELGTSYGSIGSLDKVIVEMASSDGVVGYGEATAAPGAYGVTLAGILSQIEELLVPRLIGADPLNIAELHRRMDAATADRAANAAKAALDMAAYDVAGITLGVPVSTLLGGGLRDRIPVVFSSIGTGTPEETAREAMGAVSRGFPRLKVKGHDPEADVERVRAIREALGPDTWIRLDLNEGYPTAETAIRALRAMEGCGVALVESPLPRADLHGLAEVCRALTMPVTIHQGLDCVADAATLIRFQAADVFTISVQAVGGLYKAARIVAVAETFAVPFLIGACGESGIGTAASAHLASTARTLPYDCDCRIPLDLVEDVLVEPLRIEDGFTFVPGGVGLGIAVDAAKLERFGLGVSS